VSCRRAPFPCKPRTEVAAGLRLALERLWADARHGDWQRIVAQFEEELVATVCDLEAFTVEDWERARSDLDSARAAAHERARLMEQ
jgi:hypothetical protein